MFTLIHNLLTIFAVALVFVAIGTMIWFFHFFFLRRVMRARRIANIRFRRLMTDRDGEDENPPRRHGDTEKIN